MYEMLSVELTHNSENLETAQVVQRICFIGATQRITLSDPAASLDTVPTLR